MTPPGGRNIPSGDSPFPPRLTPQQERLKVGDSQPESGSDRAPDSQTSGDTESRPSGGPNSQSPEAPESGTPKYLTLVRTEARLRDDQMVELAVLRRRVAAQRTNKSERITDNTLLRIAVDLLLAYGNDLSGDTEAELRRSLIGVPNGAALPKFRKS